VFLDKLQRQKELCFIGRQFTDELKSVTVTHWCVTHDISTICLTCIGSRIIYNAGPHYFTLMLRYCKQRRTKLNKYVYFVQLIESEMTFGILTFGSVECPSHNVHVELWEPNC